MVNDGKAAAAPSAAPVFRKERREAAKGFVWRECELTWKIYTVSR